ncbi:ECF transporter S component [Clostridium niameyense]|uniref:Riboflavin transporter n=1 Tax=Clostridium niameyense TaxID=1622073 RepID=A0A6M0R9V8_9CLOT|nr:ECF transporter S component [Clostridium niameyense]NEZ47065.1 ECF transporter S component [Clostridium niameyense]
MRNTKINKLVKISVLSTIAFLLMFIELPIPIFPGFLKLDISDLPALIGGFALGPVAGIIIELLKNVLHGIFKGSTGFVGEFANFIVGSVLVIVSSYIYTRKKNKKNAILGLSIGTVVMSIVAGVFNYYILLPLYESILNFPIKDIIAVGSKINSNITDLNSFILWAIVPFNVFKGVVVSCITGAIYKSVSPILHEDIQKNTDLAKNN